jgi:outer membrane protein OmpA-like peptidoglycan-associated protein
MFGKERSCMRKTGLIAVLMGIASIVLFAAGLCYAQDDPGCKDHPLLTRMPNFYIDSCEEKEFDQYQFVDSQEKEVPVEGTYHFIKYVLKEGAKAPSELQIVRNYTNAIQKIGGMTTFETRSQAYFKVEKEGMTTWVHVKAHSVGTAYNLVIVEKKAMVQEVTAGDMLAALNKQGFVALYINFDTDKATIKPESKPIIDQIVKLLKDNPGLKVGIEGHTDSTGTAARNKTLSQQRAESVVSALVKVGIDAKRLSGKGWGQDKPIADNKTEEGRAKNRRVEIVKK